MWSEEVVDVAWVFLVEVEKEEMEAGETDDGGGCAAVWNVTMENRI